MNTKLISQLALTVSVAFALSACQQQMRPYGKRPTVTPTSKVKPGPQKIDECPAAEGSWTLQGGELVLINRSEGFLTMWHNDLTEVVVMDGKARKIKQTVTGAEPEVTGDCSKQMIKLTYKWSDKTVVQSWNIDLEKDSLVITETEGSETKQIQGQRNYSNPQRDLLPPGGA
jgi:hypothetical protein